MKFRSRGLCAVIGIGLCSIAVVALLWMLRSRLTNAMLFYPEKGQSRTPAELGLSYESIWVTARDGVRTQGWWIPSAPTKAVVVMFHGNAGTISDRLDFARILGSLGVTVYMAEYRGYGDSEGSPSERGLYADAQAVLAEARRRSDGAPVVVFGRSLGGAVAVDLGSKKPIDGLVVESTFTNLRDMARTTSIPFASRLVAYDFDSLKKIERVDSPILIVHGDRDELVPVRMGERLRDAARRSAGVRFHIVPGGTHNDTWTSGGEPYWDAWRQFLAAVSNRQRNP